MYKGEDYYSKLSHDFHAGYNFQTLLSSGLIMMYGIFQDRADYYTLIPIKKIGNVYTFMVGFINNEKKIDCIFFKYNNSDNINIEKERHKYPYSYYSNNKNNSIEEKVLSCQLMNNSFFY